MMASWNSTTFLSIHPGIRCYDFVKISLVRAGAPNMNSRLSDNALARKLCNMVGDLLILGGG